MSNLLRDRKVKGKPDLGLSHYSLSDYAVAEYARHDESRGDIFTIDPAMYWEIMEEYDGET